MKGGLVINAFVAAAFHKFGSAPCPIKVLITADEEIGSPSSRPVIEREGRAARAVYNSEPGRPTGNVTTGRKGGVFMRFEIAGKAAHSGNNFGDGISAIGELAHKIVQIHALTDMAKGITLNVGLIAGGQSVNTTAPNAEGQIDMRYIDPADRAKTLAAIEKIVATSTVPGTTAKLHIRGEFLPLVQSDKSKIMFDAYRAAKLSLFERLARRGPAVRPRAGIVNRDDPSAGLFEAVVREAGARLVTYGSDASADVRATHVTEDARRLRIGVTAPNWTGELELRIAGRFNVHNALAVVALGAAWQLDPEAVRSGLESVSGVPGRMERLDAGQPFGVIIDYAHSPASLAKVLDLLAPVAAARGGDLVAVFGSAGERDRAKRPMMGRIAGERCRLVVVTDEDPRGEDREAILEDIARGADTTGHRRGHDLLLIADRLAAIAAAFEHARPGDIVLLAGKGHERSIIGPDGPTPWDERSAALAALSDLGYLAEERAESAADPAARRGESAARGTRRP